MLLTVSTCSYQLQNKSNFHNYARLHGPRIKINILYIKTHTPPKFSPSIVHIRRKIMFPGISHVVLCTRHLGTHRGKGIWSTEPIVNRRVCECGNGLHFFVPSRRRRRSHWNVDLVCVTRSLSSLLIAGILPFWVGVLLIVLFKIYDWSVSRDLASFFHRLCCLSWFSVWGNLGSREIAQKEMSTNSIHSLFCV